MNVVIVESPSKAKTIEKYLGKDFRVLASYGHVRDLVSKNGSVRPEEGFAMTWQVDDVAKKHLDAITKELKGAKNLYIATDPDREGEAIAWHLQEILSEKGALKNITSHRITFNAITKERVTNALAHPRTIDRPLVEAYLARLSLDYLVGFTLSPILWRKLPGSRSAGRVQSVALRLVVDRENEIEAFNSQEYWTIEATLLTQEKKSFAARLTHLGGKKLEKFDLPSEQTALEAVRQIEANPYHVESVEKKRVQRHPRPPFTTSTLQQEASRKLGFSPKKTMQVAQKLYEGVSVRGETTGLITYMRTDSTQVEGSAIVECRQAIGKTFGDPYLPDSPRQYKTKAKNAQEAHEAIRPTNFTITPQEVAHIDHDQARLYELIWKRMMASQMASAEMDQTTVDVASPDKAIILRATGSILIFDGFLTLYRESLDDDKADEDDNKLLPPLQAQEVLEKEAVIPTQHFTQPPPRYTEASIVKKMEELGIGRPTTWAPTIQTLLDRGYVRNEKKTLIPEDRGRIVTAFLLNYFRTYVEYDFTAQLEEQLDEVSNGDLFWKDVLTKFWNPFNHAIDEAKDLKIQEVLEHLQQNLDHFLFPVIEEGVDPHTCPLCKVGKLGLRLSKFGAFVGCGEYPECKYTRPLAAEGEGGAAAYEEPFERELGSDPASGLAVTVKKGPYGFYVQWGEAGMGKKDKPKRASVPPTMSPDMMTLEEAVELGSLPRDVGVDPETKEMITAAIGRFGPYVKIGKTFVSLKKDDDVFTVGLPRALELIEAKKNAPPRGRRGAPPAKKKAAKGKKKSG